MLPSSNNAYAAQLPEHSRAWIISTFSVIAPTGNSISPLIITTAAQTMGGRATRLGIGAVGLLTLGIAICAQVGRPEPFGGAKWITNGNT